MQNLDTSLFSDRLNPRQLSAVHQLEGPLLIVAGAGSGKTRVLTYRFANLIAQGLALPQDILCVTFTNKAAREMQKRIELLLEDLGIPVRNSLWISTFHSTCVRILRDYIHLLDYQPFFGIYDGSDQLSMVKKVLVQLNINDKVHPAKTFLSLINSAKSEGLTPEKIESSAAVFMDERSLLVYKTYEEQMKQANCLDFSDLLLKTDELFDMYPDILENLQDRFRYIMVDEYQDTNGIQYRLVKKLSNKHKNICVVGDEDQSIYSWRGADITNILNFEKDFPTGVVVKLEENYRSTRNIVEAASAVIKNNTQRKEKVLFTSNDEGELITLNGANTEYDEARFVASTIQKEIKDKDLSERDFAIFYRTNAQSRVLEESLRTLGIPYQIVGGVKFYERLEIKDVLGYLKVVLNPADDISVKRIINTPARGIGKTTVDKLEAFALSKSMGLLESIPEAVNEKIVHAGACKKLMAFYQLMQDIAEFSKGTLPSDLYLFVLDKTEYAQKLKIENTPESLARVENLEELNNGMVQFEQERGDEASLQSYLEEMALVSDIDTMDPNQACVTMMTLHVSKGLEYPYVFVVGMEEGLFPSIRSVENNDPTAIEEERRLAYVGMTRAEKKLYLTYAESRRVWGAEQSHTPSRFIDEIPEKYIHHQSLGGRFTSRVKPPTISQRFSKNNFGSTGTTATTDYEDFSQEYYDDDASGFRKGMTVKHPTFGAGQILNVEGSGESQRVSVIFGSKAVKKFVVKYARLEVL